MAPFDYFLKIDGVDGESVDVMHKGEIDVEAWSWGEANPAEPGGAGAGGVNMSDFSFTMELSKASPQLFLACAEGQHIKAAWLSARRGAGKDDYFLKWTFSDLLVSSYQSGAAAGQAPLDEVSFRFAKIEVEYKEQRPEGGFGAELKAGWDLKTNQKL